jgi:UDP-N-acetylglucosamine 2-epimerase (non-hydrolysing)/GDP/UDP-N,N'-diacetylbacillosamine 2-epimerase (hydrolysing)
MMKHTDNPKTKVAVFTGNRAEYGLQYPIIEALKKHAQIDCKLIVSGAHLDPNFGKTLSEIKQDGFFIDTLVDIDMSGPGSRMTATAIASGIKQIADALDRLKPDFFVVYADRFEGFAATIASTQMNIATAHIEGGDLTEGGALDDSVRHAMTKLSHLHFTTNQQATNRILAMGEEAWRVHTVGFPAIDLISRKNYATPQEVFEALDLSSQQPIVLFTQHPITTEFHAVKSQIDASLTALLRLAKEGVQVIATYPNNDIGASFIVEKLEHANSNSSQNFQLHKSLGRYLYHGVLALSQCNGLKVCCAGNSSSGIKETPVFGCPTVNIGSRQKGRLRGSNVIDVDYCGDNISKAISRCFYDAEFVNQCANTVNPYWVGGAGPKVAEIIAKTPIDGRLIQKGMTLNGELNEGWFR